MLLRAASAFILVAILVAGLWPFHAPENDVKWLSSGSGLRFGKYGSIVSSGPFKPAAPEQDSCSLEIWLQPKRVHSSGTILAFYTPHSDAAWFALRQSLGDLVLLRSNPSQRGRTRKVKVYIDDLFSRQKPVLVAIISNQAGTAVYADGALVRKVRSFRLSSQDFTGRLILGNSPVTTDDWAGQLKGLALFDRELQADEVSQHYQAWTKNSTMSLSEVRPALALYTFDERNGNVAHNQADPATDLQIPQRFFVLQEQFLERPWDEYRRDWNYWKDVGINIGGFIPLGFFFFAYFAVARKFDHPAAITIAIGFAVSLTIEVLQAFLPTRDSGMTDLITNTLGTAIGVAIFKLKIVQNLFARAVAS